VEFSWNDFSGAAKPEVVMQLDVGNALHGGGNPIPYVERYPGRAATVHVKEYSAADEKALVGEGDVNWPQFFQLCETVGKTEWYIVEYEAASDLTPLESVDRCLQNLRKMGK
jgi:sugar phosphate isomerase/epimerase